MIGYLLLHHHPSTKWNLSSPQSIQRDKISQHSLTSHFPSWRMSGSVQDKDSSTSSDNKPQHHSLGYTTRTSCSPNSSCTAIVFNYFPLPDISVSNCLRILKTVQVKCIIYCTYVHHLDTISCRQIETKHSGSKSHARARL